MQYSKKVKYSAVLVMVALIISYGVEAYSSICQINEKVIRLHVIANSNTYEDQQLKYKVRNNIINKFNKEFQVLSTKKESEDIIIHNINEIRKAAEKIIAEEGFKYSVDVYYGNYKFPRKQYEDIVLPEGNYDAVRIEIGDAVGDNWWCVMFPPLCFVDFGSSKNGAQIMDIDSETKLQEILTEDEIEAIKTMRGLNDIKLKSKIFEFIEKGRVENVGIYSGFNNKTYAESLSGRP